MAQTPKVPDSPDAANLFPEAADCFHLRVPQHFLDICEGDLLEAVLLSKMAYWASFEYKDRLRKGKKGIPDEIPIHRALSQLVGDCLGTISRKSVIRKFASLEARGLVRSERPTLARSTRDQITVRIVNVGLLQQLVSDWGRLESPVRRTRFVHGSFEVKDGEAWVPHSVGWETKTHGDQSQMTLGPVPNDPGDQSQMTRGPVPNATGLIKGIGKDTPNGVKDSLNNASLPLDSLSAINETSLAGGILGEDDSRWVIEGVNFGPGDESFHGNILDMITPQEFQSILRIIKLAQESGYGATIPASGKRASRTLLNIAQILKEIQVGSWGSRFTKAFASAFPVVTHPKTWAQIETDLTAAFAHDLAEKADGGRKPGPFLDFLETQTSKEGTISPFWAAFCRVERKKPQVGPSTILRGKVSEETMERLMRRLAGRPGPRDPKVYWNRCLQIQEYLESHRPGIKVHAALVGGFFRRNEVHVAELLNLHDQYVTDQGGELTAWPPEVGTEAWDLFAEWGRRLDPAYSFDLVATASISEAEATEALADRRALECFDKWSRLREYYVAEEVAEELIRKSAPTVIRPSTALTVHMIRLLEARRACTKDPVGVGLSLRALYLEAMRLTPERLPPNEESAWAVLGIEVLGSVRSWWREHFPERMGLPEARYFEGLPDSDR